MCLLTIRHLADHDVDEIDRVEESEKPPLPLEQARPASL